MDFDQIMTPVKPSQLVGLFALVCLLSDCRPTADLDPLSANQCRLVSSQYQEDYGQTIQYSYDPDGQLRKISWSLDDFMARFYTYNADGYLVKEEFVDLGKVIATTIYSYTDGRLTKIAKSSQNTLAVTELAYDGTGKLTQLVALEDKGLARTVYSFTNGLQSDYVNIDTNGNERRPFVFVNGRVKNTLDNDPQTRYSYDEQGRCVRQETLVNGRLSDYTDYAYLPGNPVGQLLPRPKGFPSVNLDRLNDTGLSDGLRQKATRYTIGSDGIARKTAEEVTQYKLAASGFPLEATTTLYRFDSNGQQLPSLGYGEWKSITYRYENCQ